MVTAPAAMPSVYRLADEFERELFAWRNLPSRDGAALRACAYAIAQKAEALFAPILAEKERARFAGLMLGENPAEVWKAQAFKLADDLDAALAAERERCVQLSALVDLLRDDLVKLSDAHEQCEGCSAPIADDEDACTASDVRGCWGYAADVKGAPCWRYRTKDGADRAWPECRPLAAIRAGE